MKANSRLAASLAICTYNGADRIGSVIEALATQTQRLDTWEILVIDNASSDGTREVCLSLFERFNGLIGRVIRENQAGLSFARARAAREAEGEVICFLDDDNIPAPDFVENAIRAFGACPAAGAIGGKVIASWETPPSALALAVQDFALAICDHGDESFKYEKNLGPVGAGLCIRTGLLNQIYGDQNTAKRVTGRTGNNYGGGEELAINIRVWQLGYECWYVPSLKIQHLLPVGRMNKNYLLRLYEGIGRGQAATRKFYDWKTRTPLAWLIGMKDLVRWLRGGLLGPPPELRCRHAAIAHDLHGLHQRQVWGRAIESMRPFWR